MFSSRKLVLLLKTILLASVLITGACSVMPGASNKNAEVPSDNREIRSLLKEAIELQKQNETEKAQQSFEKMMTLSPRAPNTLNSYAIFLREQWQMEEAEAVYLRAVKYAPQDAMTHWNLALLYDLYLGKPEKAMKHYQRYQKYSEEPDKRVHGWLVDLQHRAKKQKEEKLEVAGND